MCHLLAFSALGWFTFLHVGIMFALSRPFLLLQVISAICLLSRDGVTHFKMLVDWQAESKFQEEQRLQRKARGQVQEDEALVSGSEPSKTRVLKPWTIIDRKRPRHRDSRALRDDLGTSQAHSQYLGEGNGDEIDVLYDGYFRGLFTGGDGPVTDAGTPNGNGGIRTHIGGEQNSHANGNRPIRRFRSGADSGSLANGTNHVLSTSGEETGSHAALHGRRFASDRDHYSYEIASGRRFAVAVQNGSLENLSARQYITGREYATYETSSGRRYGNNLSSSGSLYSSGGSDSASYSYNSSEATALHEYSSHRHEAGPSDRWMRPVVAPRNRSDRSDFRDELSLGDPSVGPSRTSLEGGEQTTTSTGTSGGRAGRLGLGDSGISHGSAGPGSVWGGGTQTENAATTSTAGDGVPNGGQMLRGLKQRLLSFILQGIQNDDTTPAIVSLSPVAFRGLLVFVLVFSR